MRRFKNFICLFLICIIFSGLISPNIIYAGNDGNTGDTGDNKVINYNDKTGLIEFEIVVKTATSSTRYRTIGWTISISGIKIIYKYPEIPHFDFSFYLCDIVDEYKRQYGESSSQYNTVYKAMFETGGTITFDAINTVVVNGVAKGYIVDNPIYTKSNSYNYGGQVYTTLSGIQNAASWGNTTKYTDLPKYFGISFTFAKQTPKTGSITVNLTRVSGVTESISGKQFGIYDYNTEALVATKTTTSTGTLTFTSVPFKKYTVKALTDVSDTSSAYAAKTKEVTLTASNPNQTVNFQINKSTGRITVRLNKGTGVTLTGISLKAILINKNFGVYNSAGDLVTTITTTVPLTESSTGLSEELPAGTYTVKPLDRISGYSISPNSVKVTISSGAYFADFTLDKVSGSITAYAYMGNNATKSAAGCTVELLDSKGKLVESGILTGSSSASYTFSNLSYGDYIVRYSDAPEDHYYSVTEKSVSLSSSGASVSNTFYKLDIKSRIYVMAYNDSDVTHAITGRKFGVYNSSGTLVKQGAINSSGYLILDDLDAGTYTVKQIDIASGHYSAPASQTVVLEKGDTAYVDFTLCKYVSNLVIRLTSEDGASISNKEFIVTDPLGNEKAYYTNSTGLININGITAGNYKVVESEIDDYSVPDPVSFYLPQNSTATIDFYNVIQYKLKAEIISVPSEIKAGDTFNVTVRYTNSGGKTTPSSITYSQFVVSGKATLISEPYPYFSIPAKSSVTKTYTLYASEEGTAKISAEINPTKVLNEDIYTDNKAERTVTVDKNLDTNLRIEYIMPNAQYKLGTDVIVSFMVYNDGTKDIIPSNKLSVKLEAAKRESSGYVSFNTQTANNVVIPAGGSNLVYFKVSVPGSISNLSNGLRFIATVNSGNTVDELNYSDNQITVLRNVESIIQSQTPNTQYEEKRPTGWNKPAAPFQSALSSAWSVWEYINNSFVKKTYTASITGTPSIKPDPNVTSSTYSNGKWTMRSGYGFTLSYVPALKFTGDIIPEVAAYTAVQTASCYFPEFLYSSSVNNFRTLEKVSGSFSFISNSNAKGNARLHFTPIWYPDGDYTISILSQDCWTPAGMIHATVNTSLTINGNMYDDGYIGH